MKNFLGVNLRQDRIDLADAEMARSINADLHSIVGTIVRRRGATRLFNVHLNGSIRTLFKNGNNRYQVAGQTVYRNQGSIATGLSSNLITTMVAARPLNSTTTYTFIADDKTMLKDDGITTTSWGSDEPSAAPYITEGGGKGQLTGTYSVVTTYVRKDGDLVAYESGSSAIPTIPVILSASTLDVTPVDSDDSQITHIRYYRTVAGGSSYFLDTEGAYSPITYGYTSPDEADNVSSPSQKFTTDSSDGAYQCCFLWEVDMQNSITSTLLRANPQQVASNQQQTTWIAILGQPDSTLGAEVVIDSGKAPVASWVTEFQGSLFLCRDSENPHYLWYSERFLPENFPSENFLEIGNPSDPLQCAVANAGVLGVFSKKTKYRVLGNTTSGFVPQEAISHRGTPSPMSCVATEHGVAFLSNDNIYLTNFISNDTPLEEVLEPLFFGDTVNEMEPINFDAAMAICAASCKNRLYVAYPSGSHTQPDMIAVLSHETKKWYHFQFPWAVSSLYCEDEANLLAGGNDGLAYFMEDGEDDNGTAIDLDCETKDYSAPDAGVLKRIQYFKVDADCGDDTLFAEFFIDGESRGTYEITGNRDRELNNLPESCIGYSSRVKFTHSGSERIKIYGVQVYSYPLGAS